MLATITAALMMLCGAATVQAEGLVRRIHDVQGDRPHGREIVLEGTAKTAAEQQDAGREGRLGDDGQGYCAEDGTLHATGRWIVRPCVPMGMTSGSWHFAGRSRGMCA